MHKCVGRRGFTLVELSLSIAFIAILSIAVALVVTNAVTSYHRGVVLDQVNTAGMEIVDDMRAAIQNSQARSVVASCGTAYYNVGEGVREGQESEEYRRCKENNAEKFVSMTAMGVAERKDDKNKKINVPAYGVFCTGGYSYIWNSGYFFSKDYNMTNASMATFAYKGSDGKKVEWKNKEGTGDFKLLKVQDDERAVCIAASGNYNSDTLSNKFDISGNNYDIVMEEPYDVMEGSKNLALYSLDASASAESSVINNSFYSVAFILGTLQGGININAKGDYCVTPGDLQNVAVEAFDYCAINKFNFAAQANGG